MDAEEYSKSAAKFFNRKLPPIQVLTNASMGCAGEAGEFVDHIKKVAFHGHDLDAAHVLKELGDQLWYINYAIYALNLLGHNFTLSDVMQINVNKLEARYPEGFSSEASKNRVTEVEEPGYQVAALLAPANSIIRGSYGERALLEGVSQGIAKYFLPVDWPRASERVTAQLSKAGYHAAVDKNAKDGALYLYVTLTDKATS